MEGSMEGEGERERERTNLGTRGLCTCNGKSYQTEMSQRCNTD
jgi:hypothetical protein